MNEFKEVQGIKLTEFLFSPYSFLLEEEGLGRPGGGKGVRVPV